MYLKNSINTDPDEDYGDETTQLDEEEYSDEIITKGE